MNNFNLNNGDKAGILKLSSIKTPRDLSLGGCGPIKVKTNKKVYTPNVNVTRQKATDVKTSKDTTRKVRNKIEKNKFDRNRNSNNFVQTLGVFSEGVGASFKKSYSGSEPNSRKTDETRPRRQIPQQQNGKIDKKAEQRRLDDLLGDSDSNDECEFINLENHPVKLLKEDIGKLGTLKIKHDDDKNKIDDINRIFNATTSQLFLLQFPDTLPCEKSEEKEPESNADEAVPQTKTSMSLAQEGQIGKLIRYKSGKQKFILGNTIFDLNLGMESRFLQQLISLEIRSEERSGDIINMGNVSLKLTATPDWNSLLPS